MARKLNKRKSRSRRSRGGMAPVSQNDNGWSSKMSLGQGGDYLKYHVGQHGGASNFEGAPLDSLSGQGLDSSLRASAMLGGLDKAFGEIQGLRDQAGGKRRKSRKGGKRRMSRKGGNRKGGNRKSHKGGNRKGGNRKTRNRKTRNRKSHKGGNRKSLRRRGGAALGFSSFPSQGMLLDSSREYAQAGQAPSRWNGVEVAAAEARAAM